MNTQTKWAVLTQHSSEVGNKVNPVILVKHHQGWKFTFRNSTLTCLRTIEALSWLPQLKAEPRIEFSNPNGFFSHRTKNMCWSRYIFAHFYVPAMGCNLTEILYHFSVHCLSIHFFNSTCNKDDSWIKRGWRKDNCNSLTQLKQPCSLTCLNWRFCRLWSTITHLYITLPGSFYFTA